jgi:PAS domain S-box-containing protein
MTPIPRRHWLGYGVAVASTVFALLASMKLSELAARPTFLLFFPAVMLSGWLAGLGPGLLATGLSAAFCGYFLMAPRGAFDVAAGPDLLRLALFIVEGAFITVLNDAFHRSRRRVAEARAAESRATAAVADAEQRYRAFVENSSEAIWRFECEEPIPTSLPEDEQIDRMYRVAFLAECNEAMARMYGFERPADVIGVRLGQMMPREVQANVDYLRAFIRSGYRLHEAESEERDKDGNTVHFINNLVGIVEDGAVVRAWGTQRDVTDRRRAEETRRRADDLIRTVTDAIPSLISFVNREGRYVFVNAAYEGWRGQRREEIVGRRLREVIGDAGWGAIKPHVERALAGETVRFETRIMYPTGVRDVDVIYVPQRDAAGAVEGFVVLVNDVTEPKAAESRSRFLAEAAAMLSSSLDYEATLERLARLAVPLLADWCAIDMKEPDGNVRRLVAAHTDPAMEAKAKRIMDLYPARQGDPGIMTVLVTRRAELYGDIPEALLIGQSRDEAHLTMLRELGLRSMMIVPLVARERTLGVMTFVQAESGRRFTEADLALAEDLARRASLAVDNADLYRAAQAANRTKDEFLATVSHELRTPLNAILGWAQLLRSGATEEGEIDRGLETIERNARAQAQLIEDLLDISRIITGKLRLDVRPIELAPVIEAAIDSVRPAAEAKGIRLQTVLDPRAGPVSGDASRLQQVVWNLLVNAIKFTPRGGRVGVELRRVNSHVEIAVSDTGEGIDPEILPQIFDRFRQADASTTRRHGGLGLGLSIVRHLVELHGGTVHAESGGANQGALLTVKLPLAVVRKSGEPGVHPTAEEPVATPPHANNSVLEGVRVLVVDDEPDARDLLSALLRRSRAEVEAVASAAEALSAIRRARPDVLLSDIGMPDEDGYALIQKVRTLEEETGIGKIPAVALTAFARAEDRRRALMAGFQMHVPKPVEASELTAVVANLAGRT